MLIYFAAPLFSAAERAFNERLTTNLEDEGFAVFLPQRDGVEKNKPPYVAMPPDERRRAMFELDREKIFESDVFLFVLDGRVPDEGACVELGIAHAHKRLQDAEKLLVGLHTDTRAAFLGSKLNPMIRVPLDRIAEDEEELIGVLKRHQILNLLPDVPLDATDELGAAFGVAGKRDYRSAARYVRDLPYGRNTDRSDYRLVLPERRGTCSTKHALLAALAREQDVPVELRLGIYLMDGRNTPGVEGILAHHGLDHIPEAHCYLAHRGRRIDLTSADARIPDAFLHEETIEPGQIGAYKVQAHQTYLYSWATDRDLDPANTWLAREHCIAALSPS